VTAFLGHLPTEVRDKSGVLEFANLRAAGYWTVRELLDPNNGYNLALPPGRELLAELTAPRWSMRSTGVLVESKQEIKKRLGRSTDLADAIVLTVMGGGPAFPTRVTFRIG